jgi:hypothetical protein
VDNRNARGYEDERQRHGNTSAHGVRYVVWICGESEPLTLKRIAMLYETNDNRIACRSNWLKANHPEVYMDYLRGGRGITRGEGTYFDNGTYNVIFVPKERLA